MWWLHFLSSGSFQANGHQVCSRVFPFDDNCFLTLTYRDEHVPVNKSLDYDALPDFMRSLRKRFGSGIRSYGCGEYGSFYDRPHYHLLLFT